MNNFIIIFSFLFIIFLIYYELLYNSIHALFDFVGIPNKYRKINTLYLCKVKNHKYFVNPLDTIVSYPLKCGNYWESWMHNYFKKYSDKNKICLDIGANIGTHSIILSNYFLKVYSFEPQIDNYNILLKNIKINNCKNIISFNKGLSNKEANLKMKCFDKNKKNNIGAIGISKDIDKGCESIKTITLDSLNINNINFIKIDIEGHEYQAFLGGLKTLKKNKPTIIFEEHNYNSNIFKLLNSLNYNIRKISISNDYIATN
tara:strand:- start:3347 stop:4123 length:777 start_codon:yes stop_codon:yes gene_type:complete